MLRLSLQIHKWVGLVVGVQVLFWVFGGLVMTALPLDRVRGENHAPSQGPAPLALDKIMPVAEVARRADLALTAATLKSTPRGPIWDLTTDSGGEAWFDAITGENVVEISRDQARRAAMSAYVGAGRLSGLALLDEPPVEAQVQEPVWQARFDDAEHTRLYLSVFTGEVLTRRSNLWGFYDFFYRLHIMNFAPGGGYNHPLIVATTALTLAIVLTGFILLWVRLARDRRAAAARRRSAMG